MDSLFPHDIIRPGQDELLKDMRDCFSKGKILLAHAPTGLGKTATALTAALEAALPTKKKVFFLTNRHTQHQIAINTLRMMDRKISCADLIGKRWMCNQDVSRLFGSDFNEFCKSVVEKGECEFYTKVRSKKGLSVEGKAAVKRIKNMGPLHNEEIIVEGKEEKLCSYELAMGLAKEADVIIGDYFYIFNSFVQMTLFQKMEISMGDVVLVVDEGHNLPNRIMDMMSHNLTSNMIRNSIMEAKKFGYGGMISWLQGLMKVITNMADAKEKLIDKDEFTKAVIKIVDYDDFLEELDSAAAEIRKKQRRSYLGGIYAFLEAWRGEDEGFTRILSEQRGRQGPVLVLSYSCLDAGIVSKDVFENVHAGVVMSGTLQPVSMYKDVLAVKNSMDKEYSSPFPPSNKLSMIIPETSSKYSSRSDDMYKKIADKCSSISSLVPGNIAYFFPSYDFRDKVGYLMEGSKKRFWEKREMSKEEKDEFLSEFKAGKDEGGMLLGVTGANFAEGIDLPGDYLNGVVVVGLPLGRPDLKTKEVMKYYDKKFNRGWDYGYLFPALNKCFQSAGRCIRSETDKGVVIYLDERFAWQNYYKFFPREGLIVSKDYQKLLSSFFGE